MICIFVKMGFGLYAIGAIYSLFMVGAGMSSVYFAKRQNGIGISYWARKIVLGSFIAVMFSVVPAAMIKAIFSPSFARVAMTTFVCECVFLPSVWFLVLDGNERVAVLKRLMKRKEF